MDDDVDWEMSVDWSKCNNPIIEPVNHNFTSNRPPSPKSPQPQPSSSPHHHHHRQKHRHHDHSRSGLHQPTSFASSENRHAFCNDSYCHIPGEHYHTQIPAEHRHPDQDIPSHQPRHSSHSSKFRFKSDHESSRRHRSTHHASTENDEERRERRRRKRREKRYESSHHHRSRPTSPFDPPTADDFVDPEPDIMDPDVQFRESLFQAMADDEGRQFWEAVYGQPIPFEHAPGNGSLEGMTEDQYAAYMRAEMYKKTHAHAIEERERRERKKKGDAAAREIWRRKIEEDERRLRMIEESLRNGRKREEKARQALQWSTHWDTYLSAWSKLGKGSSHIPWPVQSGRQVDIEAKEIEKFFLNAPTGGKPDRADIKQILKVERVRWHPDKIQQKLGGQATEKETIQAVTAVFQIIDKLYTNLRG